MALDFVQSVVAKVKIIIHVCQMFVVIVTVVVFAQIVMVLAKGVKNAFSLE
jgi:hypothetical protein